MNKAWNIIEWLFWRLSYFPCKIYWHFMKPKPHKFKDEATLNAFVEWAKEIKEEAEGDKE